MMYHIRVVKQRGFTVVEIIIGIVLFGIIMPGVILAVMELADINDRAADLSRANILAEKKIETLRSQGYNTMIPTGTPYDFSNELDPSFGPPRSASYTVTEVQPGLKRVDVAITYEEKYRTRNLNYSTLMSELGVAQ